MDSLLNRFIAVLIMIPLGMHGIGYGVEINGGANRRNPAWRLLQSYFDFEWGVIEFLLFLGGAALAVYLVITFTNRWMDQKEEERKALAEGEKRRAREAREEEYERTKEKQLREQERKQKELEQNKTVTSSAAPVTKNSVTEVPKAKQLTPEEIKRRALAQFTGGK